MNSEIGLIGIGVMGKNLALNFLDKNISLSAYDINKDNLNQLLNETSSSNIATFTSITEFVTNLQSPKTIMLMVNAGPITDSVINELIPHLSSGDIIIDGGNSHFQDTQRRIDKLQERGIQFLGVGISGGAEGARNGPSMMPGGSRQAWDHSKQFLQPIAAKTESGIPCCQYLGTGGVGHFVKTIHNGIEYSDMQLISESYHLMKVLGNYSNEDISDLFYSWNDGRLNSYLIEITSKIFKTPDEQSSEFLIDKILDSASQKGTGKWSAHAALDLGSPGTLIATAVFQRYLSSFKSERTEISELFPSDKLSVNISDLSVVTESSLYLAKLFSYIQGFQILSDASAEYNWGLDLANVALLWSAGCIIRSELLAEIEMIYRQRENITNLFKAQKFIKIISEEISNLRKICQYGIAHGIPVPGYQTAISYFDSYRSKHLPANLIQAQRDYFGSHGFNRIDDPDQKKHHGNWID